MLDTPKQIERKIKSAVTDSEGIVKFDKENKQGVTNLMMIYSSCTGKSLDTIEKEFAGKGYGDFKGTVADAVIDMFQPIQERYEALVHSSELDDILTKGAEKASEVANETLAKVKRKMGLGR